MKYIVLCFSLIFLAAAKELVNNFQKWRTHCLFTEKVQFRSRSRLQCAAMCGETCYFDVFRYRKGKCFCADSNGGFSHQTTLDVRNVYVRRNPQPVSEFSLRCFWNILLRNPLNFFLHVSFVLIGNIFGRGGCFVVIFLFFELTGFIKLVYLIILLYYISLMLLPGFCSFINEKDWT